MKISPIVYDMNLTNLAPYKKLNIIEYAMLSSVFFLSFSSFSKIGFSQSEIMDDYPDSNYLPSTAIIGQSLIVKPIIGQTLMISTVISEKAARHSQESKVIL